MYTLILFASCSTGDGDVFPSEEVLVPPLEGPQWTSDVSLDPGDAGAPLSRIVVGHTDRESTLHIVIDDGGGEIDLTTLFPTVDHEFPLTGFQPAVPATVTVTPLADGVAGEALTFEVLADGLPETWPRIDVQERQIERVAPGWTLVGFGRAGDNTAEFAAMLDNYGAVRWIRESATDVIDIRPAGQGLVSGVRLGEAFVWDIAGRVQNAWTHTGNLTSTGIPLTDLGVHHDLVRKPDGTWLTLVLAQTDVEAYPVDYLSAQQRAPATIADEHLVNFRDDGSVISEWSLSERLDPERIGYGGLLDRFGLGMDWGHANAVSWNDERQEVVVSLRHQDAVVGLDGSSGDLTWILANPDNWIDDLADKRLDGDFAWFFHQHAPVPVAGGILLFDNGNERASPFTETDRVADAANSSRVVRYDLDYEDRVAEEAWVFDTTILGKAFSNREGDANVLDNGNILTVWGSVGFIEGNPVSADNLGDYVVLLIEVTDSSPPETVWQLQLWTPPDVYANGWTANRAVRVANPWDGIANLNGTLP